MCFICQEDVEWEHLDWGDLGWVVRPANAPEATALTVLDVVLQPGKGHAFHTHPNQQEAIYVIEGQVQQWLRDDPKNLGPNEAVFIPMNTVHATFVDPGAESPARLVVVLGPSHTEAGYEAVDVSTEEPWASLTTVVS